MLREKLVWENDLHASVLVAQLQPNSGDTHGTLFCFFEQGIERREHLLDVLIQ